MSSVSEHSASDIRGASTAAPIALGEMDAALDKALQSPGVKFVEDEAGVDAESTPAGGRRKLSLSNISQSIRASLGMRPKAGGDSDGADAEESKEQDAAAAYHEKTQSQRLTRTKRTATSTHVSLVDVLHEAECYRGVGAFGRFFVFFIFNCFVVWMHWTYHTGPFASRVQESFKQYGDVEYNVDSNEMATVTTMYDAFEYQIGYLKQAVTDSEERVPETMRGSDARPARFFPGNDTGWGGEAFQTSPAVQTAAQINSNITARKQSEAGTNLGVFLGEHCRLRFGWLRAEFIGDARQHAALARRINKEGYFHTDPATPQKERVWQFMPHAGRGMNEEGSMLAAAVVSDSIPRADTKALLADLMKDAPMIVQYVDKMVLELVVANQIDGSESVFTLGFSSTYRLPNGKQLMAVVDAQTTSLHTAGDLYTSSRDSGRAVIEVIVVCLFLFYLVDEAQDVRISKMQHRTRWSHLRSGWNILDIVSNLWLLAMIIWYIAILSSDKRSLLPPSSYAAHMIDYDGRASGSPWRVDIGAPGAFTSPAVEAGHWGTGAPTYTAAADNFIATRHDAGVRMSWLFGMVFSTFLVGLRLLKYMRFHKGLGIFTDLFRAAWLRMKDFAVIFTFFLFVLGFMLTSFFELSGGNPHFTTMAGTMAQLARLTFGFMDYDDFLNQRLGMSEFDYVSAIVFWIIIVFMFVIAQNIVLAIVVDAYEDVNISHDDMGFVDMLFLRFAFSFKCLCNRMGIKRWQPKEGEIYWQDASMYEMRWIVAAHPGLPTVLSYFKDYATNKLYRTSRWDLEDAATNAPADSKGAADTPDPYGGRKRWDLENMSREDLVDLFKAVKASKIKDCMNVVPGKSAEPYFLVQFSEKELADLIMHWEVHPSSSKVAEPHIGDHNLDISLHDVNDNLDRHFSEMHAEHSSLTNMAREIQKLSAHIRTLTDTVSELQAARAAAQ